MKKEITPDKAMGILYSASRIDPKIPCELRFIAYEDGDVEAALNMGIQAIGEQKKSLSDNHASELAQKAYEDGKKDGYVQAKVDLTIHPEISQEDIENSVSYLEDLLNDYKVKRKTEEYNAVKTALTLIKPLI